MLLTKEHYDLISQFERDCKPARTDKEEKGLWVRGIVYQDGKVNALFLAYRSGYTFGRCVERDEH
jgi:hypothetical protein